VFRRSRKEGRKETIKRLLNHCLYDTSFILGRQYELCAGCGCILVARQAAIFCCFSNLLFAGLKFFPDGRNISVRSLQDSRWQRGGRCPGLTPGKKRFSFKNVAKGQLLF
jgi:hypothetical protein